MNLGIIIKNLRKEQGITQDELAAALNLSAQSVSKWENNLANPDIVYIPLIAKFFKVSVETLFAWENIDSSIEYKSSLEVQKKLQVADDMDSIIALWEDMYFKYPNDYRIAKELVLAMCAKNDKALFHKIFKYAIPALKNTMNQTIENEILEALKRFMLQTSEEALPKETRKEGQTSEETKAGTMGSQENKTTDQNSQNQLGGPLNQLEVDALLKGVQVKKAKGKRVLIVDDANFMRMTLWNILIREGGFEVIGEATNGIEGVEAYQSLKPDIVLMDICMPLQDGVAASRQIFDLDKDACIIMVSAMSQHKLVLDCIHLGVSGFVAKPFQQDSLLKALEKVV